MCCTLAPLSFFNRLVEGKAPQVSCEINGNDCDNAYYIANDIYPIWAKLVKTVRNPNTEKTKRFSKMQVATTKDKKREFGAPSSVGNCLSRN